MKDVLITYFLGNTYAKNYRNQTVHINIIASQRWDVFLRHGVVSNTHIFIFIHLFPVASKYNSKTNRQTE